MTPQVHPTEPSHSTPTAPSALVAITGIGCRFPGGVRTPDAFWDLIRRGTDAIADMPADRGPGGRPGGFLDDVAGFDAPFFSVTPAEAAHIDPQHRLLLEVAWEALEHAGQVVERVADTTGVFVGLSTHDYERVADDGPGVWSLTGSTPSMAAGRVAHALGLGGPGVTVDAASSSSLLAVHLACQSLRAGDCTVALAGGVNLVLAPATTAALERLGVLAPDGRCKAFDAAADGFGRAEGCGVVVLKLLTRALADGDRVLAVIAGSATNQDGRGESLTAPSPRAQQAVVRTALQRAGVAPGEVAYVEAHGTGTPLGDEVELRSLGAVLGEGRPDDRPVLVGSVKTNIGHAEAAAGVAGLIKTVLALEHGTIPPNLHLRVPSPRIPWDTLPLRVPQAATPWPPGRRTAGVSAFGLSGSNVHVVLTEAPCAAPPADAPDAPPRLFPLSARAPQALRELAAAWRTALPSWPSLADVAWTACARRTHHAHRLACVARTTAELEAALAAFLEGRAHPALFVADAPATEADDAMARAAAAFVRGGPIDGDALPPPGRVATLPPYPWQRSPHWAAGATSAAVTAPARRAPAASRSALQAFVREQVAEVMGVDASSVPTDVPFEDLGLDSLMALDVRNRLEDACRIQLSPTITWSCPTVAALSLHLADLLGPEAPRASPAVAAAPDDDRPDDRIAVVGLGCRFPGGASGPDGFWGVLENQVDAVGEVPSERWSRLAAPACRWAALLDLDEITGFDVDFFRVARREATLMDPQHRLLLEIAWEALEDAGVPARSLEGSRTGVYVGVWSQDYEQRVLASDEGADTHALTGNLPSVAAGRISYVLGLRGPCLTVDTACSSSLVAIHLACAGLRRGECDLALAGGVNLIVSPERMEEIDRIHVLSPDGRCRTFDAAANGYVRAEGCGVVVLKRLSAAVRDGDRIWGVIRGSAVNQDGRSAGLTAPSAVSQRLLVDAALRDAGVSPDAVGLVEAHGTGTPLGDPIEVEALAGALGGARPDGLPCFLSSVKTNIGHAEAAAGVAGLIKTLLCMRHATVPRHLHLQALNPHIALEGTPFVIPTEARPWPPAARPRVAGVSSFGLSGTNAHVVVEEAPPARPPASPPDRPALLPLAAASPQALSAMARAWAARLRDPQAALPDLLYTASVRGNHLPHRLAVVADDAAALASALASLDADVPAAGVVTGRAGEAPPRVVFVFSGMGSQRVGAGRQLLASEPAFRDAFHACDAAIRDEIGRSVLEGLDDDADDWASVDLGQPLLFALQIGLAALWRAWGIEPDAVVGHSVGEVAAACVAGALTLRDAVRVVCRRGRLLRRLSGRGAMAVVDLSAAEAERYVAPSAGRLAVAADNGPRATAVSGDPEALDALIHRLEADGVGCRRVNVDVAFHSPQIDPLCAELQAALADIRPQSSAVPFHSTVSGEALDGAALDGAYWARNMREPVAFRQGIAALVAGGCEVFVEVGPHPVLAGSIQPVLPACGRVVHSLRRPRGEGRRLEQAMMLEALGALYAAGCAVDWPRLYPDGRVETRPPYPWQRERCWLEPSRGRRLAVEPTPSAGDAPRHPLLGTAEGSHALRTWRSVIDAAARPWLLDHRVGGVAVLPAAAWLDMAAAAGRELHRGACIVEEVELREPLVLSEPRHLMVECALEAPGVVSWRASTQQGDGDPVVHATATLRYGGAQGDADAGEAPQAVEPRCGGPETSEACYARLAGMGLSYGPAFRGIVRRWQGRGEALAHVRLPQAAGAADPFVLHPALLDTCLQAVLTADTGATPVPVGVRRMRVVRPPGGEAWCHVRGGAEEADIRLLDADGQTLVEIVGLRCRSLAPSSPTADADLFVALEWVPADLDAPHGGERGGRWLVLADRGGLGPALAQHLRTLGQTVVEVHASAVEAADPMALDPVVAPGGWRGIVHLWGLDTPHDVADAASLLPGYGTALHLVQALLRTAWRDLPPLWLVTRATQAAGDAPVTAPAQAPVWGLARTLAIEHPRLACTCVDLDPQPDEAEAGRLARELLAGSREEAVALRADGRRVGRLVRGVPLDAAAPVEAGGRPFRVEMDRAGALDDLVCRPIATPAPGPGEVTLAVHAAGLNFIDVVTALGVIPPPVGGIRPGLECAGRILAVGPDVEGLAPGQEVVALAFGTLGSVVVAPAALVVPRPPALSPQQAAGIPVAWLTAWYALAEVARLQPGERVLIHAASGAVGQAAVQWARHVGAEVLATAGSPQKRDLVRALGVQHVSDSRSLRFVDDVLAWTGGEGVDVVLNSLAGELIEAGMGLLRDHGRFVELGKRDCFAGTRLAMRPFLRNLSFSLVDLVGMIRHRPAAVRAWLEQLLGWLAQGVITPVPHTAVPVSRIHDAFGRMARGAHTGKIVITLDDPDVRLSADASPQAVRSDGAYVVTGGLGALGLAAARWLASQGAGHLVLVSRHGASTPEQEAAVAAMEAAGATVRVRPCDVADAAGLAAVLAEVPLPLRGVVHAAGVLDDGLVAQQDVQRMLRVAAPKIQGAWNLHRLTLDAPLDFFVMYSSVASLLGIRGQANYAAANAFLDALAAMRRGSGRPGLAVAWGPFARLGLAASASDGLSDRGMRGLGPAQGLEILGRLIGSTTAGIGVVALDARQWIEVHPQLAGSPLWSRLAAAGARAGVAPVRERLSQAPAGERRRLLERFVHEQVARVLRVDAARIDPGVAFKQLGVDSLIGLELRNRLEVALGLTLPTTLLWQCPHPAALCAHLERALGLDDAPAAAAMSDDELVSALRARLAALRDLAPVRVDA